jgi:hypothetical protein
MTFPEAPSPNEKRDNCRLVKTRLEHNNNNNNNNNNK